MALSIQVGQTGTLVFLPLEAGIDPEAVVSVDWVSQASQQIIRFTEPDQIEGRGPGVGAFKCTPTLTGQEKVTYLFDIECVPAGGAPPPKKVPVAIDNIVTPSP
jgi:hypothetical protein